MEIKPPTTGAVHPVASMRLPPGVPRISAADVQAVLERSQGARDLKERFDTRLGAGHAFSRADVRDLIQRARGADGKPDGDQALVMAFYAQTHAEAFAPDARPLVAEFLGSVDWAALMADLKQFVEELRQREAEAKRAEQLKASELKDEVKRDDTKRALDKAKGTCAERAEERVQTEQAKAEARRRIRDASQGAITDELTGSGVKLSATELAKLGLMKRGFGSKD